MDVFVQGGGIREKVVVLGQKCLYWGKSSCTGAKVVVFGKSGCIREK